VLKRSWKWHYLYCSLGSTLSSCTVLVEGKESIWNIGESLGIPIVSDYFSRKGSTNTKAKP
jgi:hypothetical protein